jgi:hypothetical protein
LIAVLGPILAFLLIVDDIKVIQEVASHQMHIDVTNGGQLLPEVLFVQSLCLLQMQVKPFTRSNPIYGKPLGITVGEQIQDNHFHS